MQIINTRPYDAERILQFLQRAAQTIQESKPYMCFCKRDLMESLHEAIAHPERQPHSCYHHVILRDNFTEGADNTREFYFTPSARMVFIPHHYWVKRIVSAIHFTDTRDCVLEKQLNQLMVEDLLSDPDVAEVLHPQQMCEADAAVAAYWFQHSKLTPECFLRISRYPDTVFLTKDMQAIVIQALGDIAQPRLGSLGHQYLLKPDDYDFKYWINAVLPGMEARPINVPIIAVMNAIRHEVIQYMKNHGYNFVDQLIIDDLTAMIDRLNESVLAFLSAKPYNTLSQNLGYK